MAEDVKIVSSDGRERIWQPVNLVMSRTGTYLEVPGRVDEGDPRPGASGPRTNRRRRRDHERALHVRLRYQLALRRGRVQVVVLVVDQLRLLGGRGRTRRRDGLGADERHHARVVREEARACERRLDKVSGDGTGSFTHKEMRRNGHLDERARLGVCDKQRRRAVGSGHQDMWIRNTGAHDGWALQRDRLMHSEVCSASAGSSICTHALRSERMMLVGVTRTTPAPASIVATVTVASCVSTSRPLTPAIRQTICSGSARSPSEECTLLDAWSDVTSRWSAGPPGSASDQIPRVATEFRSSLRRFRGEMLRRKMVRPAVTPPPVHATSSAGACARQLGIA